MRTIFRWLGAITVAVALVQASATLGPASAQGPMKQIQLTEKQVESFIAVQKKMATAKTEAELEAIAKEHGFPNLDEHDDVEANILLLMDSIDPQSRAFSEPPIQIKRRIEEAKADKSIPDADRKQILEDLNEALGHAQPVQFPANIELVMKYYDQIQAALQ
jgi:hypothetical protein